MKNKKERSGLLFIILLLMVLVGCEQTPRVYSLENIAGRVAEKHKIAGIIPEKKPYFSGNWLGLEHKITVCANNIMPDTLFKICLIDTSNNSDKTDSSDFYIFFFKVYGHPYLEVIDANNSGKDHSFNLVLSTYYKVSKMTLDTIIIQRLDESFCSSYMKKHGYRFFIPSDQVEEKEPNMYITEKAPRLAMFLNEIAVYRNAFMKPDTIVREK
jgi:hypothetical protein